MVFGNGKPAAMGGWVIQKVLNGELIKPQPGCTGVSAYQKRVSARFPPPPSRLLANQAKENPEATNQGLDRLNV